MVRKFDISDLAIANELSEVLDNKAQALAMLMIHKKSADQQLDLAHDILAIAMARATLLKHLIDRRKS